MPVAGHGRPRVARVGTTRTRPTRCSGSRRPGRAWSTTASNAGRCLRLLVLTETGTPEEIRAALAPVEGHLGAAGQLRHHRPPRRRRPLRGRGVRRPRRPRARSQHARQAVVRNERLRRCPGSAAPRRCSLVATVLTADAAQAGASARQVPCKRRSPTLVSPARRDRSTREEHPDDRARPPRPQPRPASPAEPNQTHALDDLRRRVAGRLPTPADASWDAGQDAVGRQHPAAPDGRPRGPRRRRRDRRRPLGRRPRCQVTAQPTGHGANDTLDQALLLRTRALGGIEVDVERRTARSAPASRPASCAPRSRAPA